MVVHARSLGIVAQIKIMGEPLLYFQIYGSVSIFGCLQKKYKIVTWKKKEFKDLEDLLVSFRLYFVIVEVDSCISTN
jgi:hypothetical protein